LDILNNKKKGEEKMDKSTLAVGGGLLIGLGVGFFSYSNLL